MDFENTFYGRPNTVKTYRSLFRKWIKPQDGVTPDYAGWTDDSTRMMLGFWQGHALSRNTQLTLLRLLGRYVEFMGGPKIDTQRFARSLDRSEQQEEVRALSSSEAAKLMEVTKRLEPRFYPVLLLAMHAGLRRGEIFGLRCSDVDMLHGQIRVARSYDGPTKNGKTRIVPMSDELARTLITARNLLLRGPDDKVFEQFDPNPVLRRLLAHVGIEPMKFHDLRHTFATLALENKTSPKQVQKWLGHSSVVTTLGIYWNLTGEEASLDFLPEVNK